MNNRKKIKEKLLKNLLTDFDSMGISIIPPDSKVAVKKLEKRILGSLNETLKEFYSQCDGYMLNWQGKLDGFKIKGQTSIRPVSILDNLSIGNNKVLSFSNLEHAPNFSIDSLMIFDIIDNLGNYVLLRIDVDNSSLYLYTYGKKLNKMDLTIAEYLLKAEDYFGTELWQQFYIEKADNISNYYCIYKNNITFYQHLLEPNEFKHVKDSVKNILEKFNISNINFNYKNAINDKLEALKKQSTFYLSEFNLGTNVSANSLMKAQESICQALPQPMIDFYAQINGLEIEWEINNISGNLNYLCLEEIYGGNEWYNENDWNKTNYHNAIIWIGEDPNDEFYQISRELRPLEIFSGDSSYVGFRFSDANIFEIYYAFNRDELIKLPISIEKYLHLNIRLFGLEGWQEYYRSGKHAKIGEDYLIDHINTIFPDFKIEEFH
ncbi:hypothetical protein [Hwangdonia seohaensis]|uniref:Knr4/Smi1-like domain-containing protein n=1 Tax=Hwangdonia seohaensis TaxID=1240727 RepID=A0ABW3RFS9_9FLAO|nr:hypothetical protein [Hwangdonia seohaensis]